MSIEGIVLENFSALQQPSPLLYLGYLTYNAVFHSLFPDDSKHDAATTSTQSKKIIELLQNRQLFFWVSVLSGKMQMAVRRNTDLQMHYIYCQCWHTHIIL